MDEARELDARRAGWCGGLRYRRERREHRVSAYPVRAVDVEGHLVGVLRDEEGGALLVDVVAVGWAVHAEREEGGPRARANGVRPKARALGEFGECRDGDGIRG